MTCELIIVFSFWPHCWVWIYCTLTLDAGGKQHASVFPTWSPGSPKLKKEVETLLYFKTGLKLLGPICSWSHYENIAQSFAGTESGPFALMWRGNDERQAENGNLSPWVSSHPTSFPLSSVFSYFHTRLIPSWPMALCWGDERIRQECTK